MSAKRFSSCFATFQGSNTYLSSRGESFHNLLALTPQAVSYIYMLRCSIYMWSYGSWCILFMTIFN